MVRELQCENSPNYFFFLKQVICIYHQFEADANEQKYLSDNLTLKNISWCLQTGQNTMVLCGVNYSEISIYLPLVIKIFLYVIEKIFAF